MPYFLIWSLCIKCLVHHAVYCISLCCLLSFLCNPYIPFLIYKMFHLLVKLMVATKNSIMQANSELIDSLITIRRVAAVVLSNIDSIDNPPVESIVGFKVGCIGLHSMAPDRNFHLKLRKYVTTLFLSHNVANTAQASISTQIIFVSIIYQPLSYGNFIVFEEPCIKEGDMTIGIVINKIYSVSLV